MDGFEYILGDVGLRKTLTTSLFTLEWDRYLVEEMRGGGGVIDIPNPRGVVYFMCCLAGGGYGTR